MNKVVYRIDDSTTLKDVIFAVDRGGVGAVILVDNAGYLVGIVTDGDIRRAVLNDIKDLKSVINCSPHKMNAKCSKKQIVAKLRSIHRRHMPLVDENNFLIDVFSLDDIEFIQRAETVVVMAGGLGSRLGVLTEKTPKPMLNVGNRPMLHHLVDFFKSAGFCNFVFCVNYKKEIIIDYFGSGDSFDINISYIEESQKLGTAGALSLIDPTTLSESFFVINADVLTTLDFSTVLDYHYENSSFATMCVRKYCHNVPFGVVESDSGEIVSISEKPSISFDVNAGIYVLNKSSLDFIEYNNYLDMPEFFKKLIVSNLKVMKFNVDEYWLDIGRVDDLSKANMDMSSKL